MGKKCSLCRLEGHRKQTCPSAPVRIRVCTVCGDPNHRKWTCPNVPGHLGEHRCATCKLWLPIGEFNLKNKTTGELQRLCKECMRPHRRRFYKKHHEALIALSTQKAHERKEAIRELKSKPCTDCGKTYHWFVMDFDHVRGEKKGNVSTLLQIGKSLGRLLEEVERLKTERDQWIKGKEDIRLQVEEQRAKVVRLLDSLSHSVRDDIITGGGSAMGASSSSNRNSGSSSSSNTTTTSNLPSPESIERYRRGLNADMERPAHEDGRPPIKPENYIRLQWQAIEFTGPLVDIAFVRDENIAKLLSWYMGRNLGALIVDDKAKYFKLWELGATVWCLEQTSKYYVLERSREKRQRNAQEKASGKLPLKPISARGFVDYAINMVELSPRHEHLRDTVLWEALRSLAVFQTRDDAYDYNTDCATRGVTRSPSVTLDGYRFNTSGPSSKNDVLKPDHRFDFMFGWKDGHGMGDRRADADKLAALPQLVSDLRRLEDEERGLESQPHVEELTRKINGLNEQVNARARQSSQGASISHSLVV